MTDTQKYNTNYERKTEECSYSHEPLHSIYII